MIKMNDVTTQMALCSQVIISSSLLPDPGGEGSSLQIILLLLLIRIKSQNVSTPERYQISENI